MPKKCHLKCPKEAFQCQNIGIFNAKILLSLIKKHFDVENAKASGIF